LLQNNINPSQQPRGYGDVAVIWKKEIHHLIKPCKDGNERIQCIEFKDKNIYLPLSLLVYEFGTGKANVPVLKLHCFLLIND
jgi:hypothetical protein